MQITKEKLNIDETLNKKIKNEIRKKRKKFSLILSGDLL